MQTQDPENSNELISALVDGELGAADFAQAMALIESSPQARSCWQISHLAGDVLRARELAQTATGDADFVQRLRQRLADEPTLARPRSGSVNVMAVPAANEARMRWKLVAGLASLAIFLGGGWHLVGGQSADQGGPQLVLNSPSLQAEQITMLRDSRLDQLLAAHQQLGGATALQKPTGFLRSATYERPAR